MHPFEIKLWIGAMLSLFLCLYIFLFMTKKNQTRRPFYYAVALSIIGSGCAFVGLYMSTNNLYQLIVE